MWISKLDIAARVKFSKNINDNDINPAIEKAERLLPRLKSEIEYQLSLVEPVEYTKYKPGETVTAGQYKEYRGKLYQALTTTILAPDTPAQNYWQEEPLKTVLQLYIKPFLIYKAYDLFLVTHGTNVTDAGITRTRKDDYDHVDNKIRYDLINSIKEDVLYFQNGMMKALGEYGYLEQEQCRQPVHQFGISVLNRKHRRGCGCHVCSDSVPPVGARKIFDDSFDNSFE